MQPLIISDVGAMKLLEALDKQALHGSLLGSSCLHKAAMSASLLVASIGSSVNTSRQKASSKSDHPTDNPLIGKLQRT